MRLEEWWCKVTSYGFLIGNLFGHLFPEFFKQAGKGVPVRMVLSIQFAHFTVLTPGVCRPDHRLDFFVLKQLAPLKTLAQQFCGVEGQDPGYEI